MKANKKKPYGRKLFLAVVLLGALAGAAKAEPIQFTTGGGHAFVLPLQSVSGTQLYSFREGKGFPALESVLYVSPRKKFQATFGAAAELGRSVAVPFAGAQWRLSERFFDTSDNDLYFGLALAKHPDSAKSWRGVEVTLKASTALW